MAARCVCDAITTCDVAVHLALVAHHRELKKATNTGTLAARVLAGGAIHAWGDGAPLKLDDVIPEGHAGFVLTATAGSAPLDPDALRRQAAGRPLAMVVPDGSWRQASKMPRRVPGLDILPWAHLPPGPPTRYRLRDEQRDYGLATIEAIARALALLGETRASAALERAFEAFVAATMAARGRA